MKSVLIIGMGRFGRHLCMNISRLGHQIMIVDDHEENLEEMLPYVVSAKIGDCTKPEVLKSLGIANFDLCFVCLGMRAHAPLWDALVEGFDGEDTEVINVGDSVRARRIIEGTDEGRHMVLATLDRLEFL